jgi:hypothetical protein
MIINDLHIVGTAILPPEANPPLRVDADAELPLSITMQRLESIARQHSQRGQTIRRIEDPESLLRLTGERSELANRIALE